MDRKFLGLLLESFAFYLGLRGADVIIYKNPKPISIKSRKNNRGWVLPNGDLYLEGEIIDSDGKTLTQAEIDRFNVFPLHIDIYNLLARNRLVPQFDQSPTRTRDIMDNTTNGFGVIRIGSTNILIPSESHRKEARKNFYDIYKGTIDNFVRKNESWTLDLENGL